MPKLDIIVTHHEESQPEIEPFFTMLKNQQNVDFSDITVTVVDTGTYHPTIPYHDAKIVGAPGSNAATARNTGFSSTSSPWVMFCDCDDMFADVCSLSSILDNIPTEDCDVIWSRTIIQTKRSENEFIFYPVNEMDFTTTDGKIYRRDVLTSHGIGFPEFSRYDYEYIFNAIVLDAVPPHRIAKLTTDFYVYYKRYRENSLLHSCDAYCDRANDIRKYINLTELFASLGEDYKAGCFLARALYRAYYEVHEPVAGNPSVKPVNMTYLLDVFRKYHKYYDDLLLCDREPIQNEILTEVSNLIQGMYNEHGVELYFWHDNVPYEQWFNNTFDVRDLPPTPDNPEPSPGCTSPAKYMRVAVYTGTRNVYQSMLTSAKSLLCHTAVDKIYFLIEDNTFPFQIPDTIECIDVSPIEAVFKDTPTDGNVTCPTPNYNNPWTWMCLVRAFFPELFERTDQVLSLDIDTIIEQDISDLWDTDLDGYYLAGVPEPQRQRKSTDPIYINFGVVLMNLKKMREDGIQQKVIDLLLTTKLDCPEQTAYNRICANRILPLDAEYNHTAFSHITGESQNPKIVHYAGQKFWRHYSLPQKYEKMPINEVADRQMQLQAERISHE